MRDIKNYEGLYGITSCGRVWSYISNKFLEPKNDGHGYLFVTLCKDGECKNIKIHRLVAEAYIPNPEGLETVDHIDNNKRHNYVSNLQWLSRIDNLVKELPQFEPNKIKCLETGEIFDSIKDCASKLNIDASNLSKHLKGKYKKVHGLHFERVYE